MELLVTALMESLGLLANDSTKPQTGIRETVKAEASKAKASNGNWHFFEDVAPVAAVVNLPVGLVMGLIGAAGSAVADHRSLSEARMPDTWMAEISMAPDVSKKGLAFLARRLADPGFISVQDGVDFLKIEEEAEKAAAAEKVKAHADAQPRPGANALLERARAECGEALDPTIFERAKSTLRMIDKYTPDAKTLAKVVPGALSAFGRVMGKST